VERDEYVPITLRVMLGALILEHDLPLGKNRRLRPPGLTGKVCWAPT